MHVCTWADETLLQPLNVRVKSRIKKNTQDCRSHVEESSWMRAISMYSKKEALLGIRSWKLPFMGKAGTTIAARLQLRSLVDHD